MTVNGTDTCDDSRRGSFVAVHSICRKGAELEKWSIRIDDQLDAFADKQLAAFLVTPDRGFTTTLFYDIKSGSKFRHQFLHGRTIGGDLIHQKAGSSYS